MAERELPAAEAWELRYHHLLAECLALRAEGIRARQRILDLERASAQAGLTAALVRIGVRDGDDLVLRDGRYFAVRSEGDRKPGTNGAETVTMEPPGGARPNLGGPKEGGGG